MSLYICLKVLGDVGAFFYEANSKCINGNRFGCLVAQNFYKAIFRDGKGPAFYARNFYT